LKTATVNSEICGVTTIVKAKKVGEEFEIEVDTPCVYAKRMLERLPKHFTRNDLIQTYDQHPVHKAAQAIVDCTPCILPPIIVQLLWAEAAMAILKPITITFK